MAVFGEAMVPFTTLLSPPPPGHNASSLCGLKGYYVQALRGGF